MPLIPYPNVPAFPGVPALVRNAVSSPVVNLALGTLGNALLSSLQSNTKWGIYNVDGTQLGGVSGLSLLSSLVKQPTILSTVSVDFMRETRVSDFPIEAGSFASYNKTQLPANPTVVLALSGSSSDRNAFLNALEAACISTDQFNIVTPDFVYPNYTIERYVYRRSAEKGATLLTVEIALKEIREVAPSYTTVAPITNPQSAGASSQISNGNVQTAAPAQSTLLKIVNSIAGAH